MKVRALRGVCIGPGRNLAPGDLADLGPSDTQFLVSIKAVEVVKEKPARAETPPPADEPALELDPPAAEALPPDEPEIEDEPPPTRRGKKAR